MRRIGMLLWVGSMIAFLLVAPNVTALPNGSDVVICAMQTTGANEAAGQEYIAVCNPSDSYISLTGWSLEYYSANKIAFDMPSATIQLLGSIAPHSIYGVGTATFVAEPIMKVFNATLAKDGGHIRLVSKPAGQLLVHDTLGYGTAKLPEGSAALPPAAGERLVRQSPTSGMWIDTDNNSKDFAIPGQKTSATLTAQTTSAVPTTKTIDTRAPFITELLPNPASPQRDSEDEFIELYNPYESPITLDGMSIQVGITKFTKYTIKTLTIGAREYAVIYSKTSNVALTNSGSSVKLISPSGIILSETQPYTVAKEGEAWAVVDGEWHWTTTPTPGSANIVTAPQDAQKTTLKSNQVSGTTNEDSQKNTKKVRATSTTAKPTNPTKTEASSPTQSSTAAPLHPSIIAGVGLLAVVYAGYEYREDIANLFRKYQSYRAHRRAHRQKS